MNNYSKITIIVASLNSAKTIQRCINSYIDQFYPYKELIVIDGGSSDSTIDIIKYNYKYIDWWISEKDRGIADAWNKGLIKSSGDWVLFLGADDILASPEVLQNFSNTVSNNYFLKCRVFYGNVNVVYPDGEYFSMHGSDWPAIRKVFFSEKMMIPHQACFHHSSIFKDFGFFDEKFKIVADYELLLRVLKNEDAFFVKWLIVTNMYLGGVSSRVSSLLDMQKECDSALVKNGFNPSGYRRKINITVYTILGWIIRYGGEKNAAKFLDAIRIMMGKKIVWSRK